MARLAVRSGWHPRAWGTHPAFSAVRPLAGAFADLAEWPTVEEIDARLGAAAGIRFVRAAPRGRRRPPSRELSGTYDARIAAGEVPTRARSWHDFFNALIWATFPRAKRALHARQYAALRARVPSTFAVLPGARTEEQDQLAMVDEGGILRVHAGGAAHALVFGHALLEHLVSSDAPVRGRAVPLLVDGPVHIAAVDAALALALADATQFTQRSATPALQLDGALFRGTLTAAGGLDGTAECAAARR